MSSGYSFIYSKFLESPWAKMVPIILGEGATKGTYFLLIKDDDPCLVFEIRKSERDECWFRHEAIYWNGVFIIGLAERVYVVNPSGKSVNGFVLDEYFSEFITGESWLLVATGGRVLRLDQAGNIVWKSDLLALDGVVIEKVVDGKIYGEGQWNPPDGWRKFELKLTDGAIFQ